MKDATGESVSVRVAGASTGGERAEFGASGKIITFYGFLKAYVEDTDESAEKDDEEKRLPRLARGDGLDARGFEAQEHHTSPPARYTEASLVKALEELGIGRPSTYASILQTIQDRGYVWKRGAALIPSWTAFAVVGLLESYFTRLVDYGFTASVEEDLDSIANGETSRLDWLRSFYFVADGAADSQRISAQGGLKRLIESRLAEIDARGVNSIPVVDGVVVRVGRYGPYLERGGPDGERASLPEDLPPDELTAEKVEELLQAPSGDRVLGELDGREVTVKSGRYGPYVN
jgi:DNA topoisomerase-1